MPGVRVNAYYCEGPGYEVMCTLLTATFIRERTLNIVNG